MENLETVSKLVGIKSFDLNENDEIIAYLTSRFEPFADSIVKIKNPGSNKNNLLVFINSKPENQEDLLVLSGHIDTVVASEKEYKTNPYKATLVGGKLFGLGVIDMKCFFASVIDNLEFIKSLNVPVCIVVTCDEETELKGIEQVVAYFKQNCLKPKLSIIGEPTSRKICLSSKGCYEYRVNIAGKSCHSSRPENGVNANYIAAKLICEIEQINSKFSNTTLSVGKMNGGERVNIVPKQATLSFDVRSKTKKETTLAIKMVKEKIKQLQFEYAGSKIKLKKVLAIPPLENIESKFVSFVVEKYGIDTAEFIGGCEAGYLQGVGGRAILYGVGDLNLAHKPNEYMVVAEFNQYNQSLTNILKDFAQQKNTP